MDKNFPPKEPRWTAKGEVNEVISGKDKNIPIRECEKCIDGKEKGIFGKPIHAKLGVRFIGRFWNAVKNKNILSIQDEIGEKIDAINNYMINFDEKDKNAILKETNKIRTLAEKSHDWLRELLARSFALTSDRSILLKILSQPRCEGIRFYAAMKNKGGLSAEFGLDGMLTFVCVGVDQYGVDLHYGEAVDDIENISLSGEYPGQPVPMTDGKIKEERGPNPRFPELYPFYVASQQLRSSTKDKRKGRK